MAGEYTLDGLAVPESMALLHDLLDRVRSDRPELDADALSMFETAVVEIHGNVVQHGRPKGEVLYSFALDVLDDRLVGVLTDNGAAAPDLSEAGTLPDAESESGRGLWLAQAALSDLRLDRVDGRNRWTMTRLLDGDGQ
jgi:serine/threonine-protein kinase RsbW